jgi:hypothetical protein
MFSQRDMDEVMAKMATATAQVIVVLTVIFVVFYFIILLFYCLLFYYFFCVFYVFDVFNLFQVLDVCDTLDGFDVFGQNGNRHGTILFFFMFLMREFICSSLESFSFPTHNFCLGSLFFLHTYDAVGELFFFFFFIMFSKQVKARELTLQTQVDQEIHRASTLVTHVCLIGKLLF